MPIPEVPLSCCCDWGTGRIGRAPLDQWFLVGFTGSATGYDIIDSAGTVILNNQTGFGTPYLCDDQGAIYSRFTFSTGDGNQSFPRWRKYDSGQTQIWSHDDGDTDLQGLNPGGAISTTTFHFDVDGGYSFYYCGRSDRVADANTIARLVKLDSSGNESWVATAHESFTGATLSIYGFFSCAVDLNGNVCAVGFRRKDTGSVVKSDYIVYCFDSTGAELWHDDIADDATLNSNNFGLWAVQCCFDNAGNVYVGFGYGGTSKTLPFVRKYDTSGNEVWTKTVTSANSSCYCLLLNRDEKLLVQSNASSSIIRQYSGASHGTLDWTHTITATGSGGDMTVDLAGDVYGINSNDGTSIRWRKVNGSTGSLITSGGDMVLAFRCFAKPGKHPHFI